MLMSFVRFLKNWTLPVAMAFGTAVYLTFAYTPQLASAALFFAPVFDAILPLFMFCILFVTFCKVDFRRLRPVPWHWWVALFQILFVAIIVGAIAAIGAALAVYILLAKNKDQGGDANE